LLGTHFLAAELPVAVLVELLQGGRRSDDLCRREFAIAIGIQGQEYGVLRPVCAAVLSP
jgi:hypothetical protein